jgi:hypothetical protein
MTTSTIGKRKAGRSAPLMKGLLAGLLSVCSFGLDRGAQAEPGPLAQALYGKSEETPFLDVRGWLAQGFTWNTTSESSYNGTISFNDRAQEYQMNQLYLILEHKVAASGDAWDLGGRVDFLYGTDTPFTTSIGFDDRWGVHASRYYRPAVPQAYLEANVPVWNGVSIKAGHFYTPIGYEVVTAPDNFFYSHAYTMQYGEPFTHWGVLSSTSFCDGEYTFSLGAVQGWDNMSDTTNHNLSTIGGVTWAITDKNTLAATMIGGNEDSQDAHRYMYSLVLTNKITDKFTYVVQHDHGIQLVSNSSSRQWFGLNQYFLYTLSDTLSAGVRAEWFRDEEGVRVVGVRSGYGGKGDYYELTTGVNYKAHDLVTIRPELRWDIKRNPRTGPFDRGQENTQLVAAVDAIVKF